MADNEPISPATKAQPSHYELEEMPSTDTYKEIQSLDPSQLQQGSEYRTRCSSGPTPFSQTEWRAHINNIDRQHRDKMARNIVPQRMHYSRLSNESQQIHFGANLPEVRQRKRPDQNQEHFAKAIENTPTVDPSPQPYPTQIQEILRRLGGFVPRSPHCQPDAELIDRFQSSIRDSDDIGPMAWLLIAVWWLLKARKTLEHYGRRDSVRSGASIGSSMASSLTSSNQAYVDLLKASFILYDIVLYDKRLPDFLSRECQKVLVELSEGIGETATRVIALGIPEYPAGQPQNTNLQEQDLLEEFPSNNGTPFSSLERTHWVTVKLEDVGEEGEKALFRTFINATSTCKTTRRWTKDAPYMLLLSVKDVETEPRITICNQSGTLCLQRNFEQTDLKDLTLADGSLNGIAEARITEPLSFDFDNRRIEVSFQFYGDYMAFIRIPKEYFEAVSLREPIDRGQSSETVLFKSPVEEYERLKAPEMKSMHPPNIHKSCEVRILERSSSQAWSTTRRLVISMSIAKKNPGCMGFFMPLSRVDVNRDENSCEVQVKWSDTLQPESTQTDGNYHPLYSYVYNANKPNIGIKLRFRTPRLAEKFEKEIFGIGYRSIFSWDQCGSRGIVYDVEGADQKPYKAIALYRGTTPWRGTDLFYLYRDSDYIYEHAHLRVRFPGLTYTNYLSTCVGQISAPQRPVEFSGCEKRVQKNVTVEFDDEQTMRTFMSSLASSYELVYSRSAMSLKTKSRGIFGVTRALSSKGATEVQLWRRGNHFQLASRWADHIQNRWLTMSVPLPELRTSGHSNRVEFPPMPYFRGPVLDFANILARGPAKSPSLSERKGPITITFATSRDQEEFVDILRSSATRPV